MLDQRCPVCSYPRLELDAFQQNLRSGDEIKCPTCSYIFCIEYFENQHESWVEFVEVAREEDA